MTAAEARDRRTPRCRVGVTLFIREGSQSIWENGIFQNCYLLLKLLIASRLVERAFIVNGGPGDPGAAGAFLDGAPAPVLSLAEAMEETDILIELSAQIDADWGRQFAARGGKIVGMRVANDFVIDTERMCYGLAPGMLIARTPFDEIWTLPAFESTCASYYSAAFRAPVHVMPHLWDGSMLQAAAEANGANPGFAYAPRPGRWRLAIVEPNICSVKTCHVPLLVADAAHRLDPGVIEYARVYNGITLKTQSDFVTFAKSLDLVRQGIATFEPRLPIVQILGDQADAILSHHWENGQNYVYYEALHGGFPLIHNSSFLGDCGYRYRDFDVADGALALIQAFREHDLDLAAYRARAARFLKSLNPVEPRNILAYERRLSHLLGLNGA